MANRAELRSKDYMKGIDEDDARKKRDSLLVELRKNKREDVLAKRRQLLEDRIEPNQMPSIMPDNIARGQEERVSAVCLRKGRERQREG